MFIKLSNELYLSTEHIESINWHTVTMASGEEYSLSEAQFSELLSALPTPYDAEQKRLSKQARAKAIERIGMSAWVKLSEDEQSDMLSAESEERV